MSDGLTVIKSTTYINKHVIVTCARTSSVKYAIDQLKLLIKQGWELFIGSRTRMAIVATSNNKTVKNVEYVWIICKHFSPSNV